MKRNYRKGLVLVSINWISFSNGFLLGHMASMVQSLKRREEGLDLSDGQISIIASSLTGICILGMAIAAVMSDKFGRRWSFSIAFVPTVINYVIVYFAKDMTTFMLSRVLAGIGMGAIFSLKLCVTSEYAGPKTRAVFLNMISTLAPSLGACASHALGIILHWRTMSLIGIAPSIVSVIIPYFWLESPHWLASKGRFEECEEAFRELHGSSTNTEKELQLLLGVERTKLQKAKETNSLQTLKKLLIACKRKYFWDLMLLSVFISAFLAAAGKLAFSTLAVTIIEGITGSKNIFVFTMVVDMCVIVGALASCLLIKRFSMRTMLFSTGFVGVIVLLCLSVCLYFKTDSIYFQWANVSLLSVYFIIVKAGPYPVLEALLGEIFPLELKVQIFFFAGSIFMGSMTLTIVLLHPIVSNIGYHGLFMTNAILMCISLTYIWYKLPETKGRTLQEIEIYFKTKTFHQMDDVIGNNDQIKALI